MILKFVRNCIYVKEWDCAHCFILKKKEKAWIIDELFLQDLLLQSEDLTEWKWKKKQTYEKLCGRPRGAHNDTYWPTEENRWSLRSWGIAVWWGVQVILSWVMEIQKPNVDPRVMKGPKRRKNKRTSERHRLLWVNLLNVVAILHCGHKGAAATVCDPFPHFNRTFLLHMTGMFLVQSSPEARTRYISQPGETFGVEKCSVVTGFSLRPTSSLS